MKAVVLRKFGGAEEALELVEDYPKPKRAKGEVLIQVHGTSLNPVDCKTRRGEVPRFLVKLPKVLGGDVSGIVVESDSDTFPIGTRVMALTEGFQMWKPWGCYCEYVSVPESQVVIVPEEVDLTEAGGVPLVAVTAYMALDAAGHADGSGKKILIHGGAGGVGTMCVQLAKYRGYEVSTSCSERNREFCIKLGADHVIDYKTSKFWEVYKKGEFDVVIDLIGGDVETHSLALLDSSGVFISVLNSGWVAKYGVTGGALKTMTQAVGGKIKAMLKLGPSYKLIMVSPNKEMLQDVSSLLAQKAISPVTSKVVPLSNVFDAHQEMDNGLTSRGKVVFSVRA